MSINAADAPIASNNILLLNGCVLNTDFLLFLILNTCTNSENANTINAIVWPISTFTSCFSTYSAPFASASSKFSTSSTPYKVPSIFTIVGKFSSGVAIPIINAASVSKPIITPWYTTLKLIPFVKIPFCFFGFRFITSSSAGSTANANAGSESVTKLIHNIWIGSNTSIKPISILNVLPSQGVIRIAKNSTIISPTLLESKNWIAFSILS